MSEDPDLSNCRWTGLPLMRMSLEPEALALTERVAKQ